MIGRRRLLGRINTELDDRTPWQLVATAAALGLLSLGMLAQLPELAVFAIPFALMVLVPARLGVPALRADLATTTAVRADMVVGLPPTAQDRTRTHTSDELTVVNLDAPGVRDSVHLLGGSPAGAQARFALPVSGRATIGRIAVQQVAADGLRAGRWSPSVDVRSRSWPHVAVRRTPAPVARRLARNPGSHRSRNAGSGTDPKDIRPLTPSDSLRDVDWRATARSVRAAPEQGGELLVRERHAEQQGPVRLVIDTSDDLSWNPVTWYHPRLRTVADPSLLSEARGAALTLATVHVRSGDRVGLSELNDGGVPVPAATGNRQLDRLRAHLGNLGAARWRRPWKRIVSAPQPGSMVYVLSAFLDPLSVERAMQWSAHGHRVIAVDIGGPLDSLTASRLSALTGRRQRWLERWLRSVDDPRLTEPQALSCRLVLAQRRAHLAELRGSGIELLSWSTPDAAALTLVQLDRQRVLRHRVGG